MSMSGLGLGKKAVLALEKWFSSWLHRSWSWNNRWSWSCNLMVLLHHWYKVPMVLAHLFVNNTSTRRLWSDLFDLWATLPSVITCLTTQT